MLMVDTRLLFISSQSTTTILDGVTIGKGSVIGAGTLVAKDIPAGSVVVDKRDKVMRVR